MDLEFYSELAVKREELSYEKHRERLKMVRAVAIWFLIIFLIIGPAVYAMIERIWFFSHQDYNDHSAYVLNDEKPSLDVPELIWLPDGMKLAREYEFQSTHYSEYAGTDGKWMLFTRLRFGSDTKLEVDTEDSDLISVIVLGQDAELYVKGDKLTLIWNNENYILMLAGNLDSATMIKIAASYEAP